MDNQGTFADHSQVWSDEPSRRVSGGATWPLCVWSYVHWLAIFIRTTGPTPSKIWPSEFGCYFCNLLKKTRWKKQRLFVRCSMMQSQHRKTMKNPQPHRCQDERLTMLRALKLKYDKVLVLQSKPHEKKTLREWSCSPKAAQCNISKATAMVRSSPFLFICCELVVYASQEFKVIIVNETTNQTITGR